MWGPIVGPLCSVLTVCKLPLLQVTPEQIQAAVALAIDRDRERLLEDRYHANTNGLLGAVCSRLLAMRFCTAG